jgi:hypothetical protein
MSVGRRDLVGGVYAYRSHAAIGTLSAICHTNGNQSFCHHNHAQLPGQGDGNSVVLSVLAGHRLVDNQRVVVLVRHSASLSNTFAVASILRVYVPRA